LCSASILADLSQALAEARVEGGNFSIGHVTSVPGAIPILKLAAPHN
jgi:hypothetical protein